MQRLSKRFSPQSLLPVSLRLALERLSRGILAPDDPFQLVRGRTGVEIKGLPGNLCLLLEPGCLLALLSSVAMYGTAALLANEWLYLLAASLCLVSLFSIVMPVAIVSLLYARVWLPNYGSIDDRPEIGISLRQPRWLGPLKLWLPLSCMRARLIMVRRTADGWASCADTSEYGLLVRDAGSHVDCNLKMPQLSRGVYCPSHIDVGTCLPFGFAWAIKSHRLSGVNEENKLVVLPLAFDIRGDFLLSLEGIQASMGMTFANVRAFSQSTSVRGIREFRVGDSLRHIHWPSSARLNRLLVREFESEVLPVFDLYLDLCAGWQSREQFELAVTLTNSLIQFGHQRDMLPELFVRPAADGGEMHHTLYDLPQMKTPLEMLAELLARVEPMPQRGHNPEATAASRNPVLAVMPCRERMIQRADKQGKFPVQLVALSQQAEGARASARVIATVFGTADLQTL